MSKGRSNREKLLWGGIGSTVGVLAFELLLGITGWASIYGGNRRERVIVWLGGAVAGWIAGRIYATVMRR